MLLTFVDRNGNSAEMTSAISITEMIGLRHEGAKFYNHKAPACTIADAACLSYTNLETLRRSQTWMNELTEFIAKVDSLEDTEATRKHLGEMPAERKSQPQKGNRNGSNGGMSKGAYQALGQLAVERMTRGFVPEDKMVTAEWATDNLN